MSSNNKNQLKEQYSRLKKALKKILNPERTEQLPQLVLQPVRNKKYF